MFKKKTSHRPEFVFEFGRKLLGSIHREFWFGDRQYKDHSFYLFVLKGDHAIKAGCQVLSITEARNYARRHYKRSSDQYDRAKFRSTMAILDVMEKRLKVYLKEYRKLSDKDDWHHIAGVR